MKFPKQKEFVRVFRDSIKKFRDRPTWINDIKDPQERIDAIESYMAEVEAYLYFYLIGGVSSGKSFIDQAIGHQILWDYSDLKCAIVRQSLKTLKRNSLPTYKKILKTQGQDKAIRINRSDYVAFYPNDSEMLFVEANEVSDPDFDNIYGLEVTFAIVEECNQTQEKANGILKTRVGRWNNDKYDIPPFILYNCNPNTSWVKEKIYDPWIEGTLKPPYYVMELTPFDNPYNSDLFLAGLRTLPETEYARLVENNWEYSDDPCLVLRYEHYKNALVEPDEINRKRVYLGIDSARYGDDFTVFAFRGIDGFYKWTRHKWTKDYEVNLARAIKNAVEEEGIEWRDVIIEVAAGYGAGAYDILRSQGYDIRKFNPSEVPTDTPKDLMSYTFKNKRAEAAWLLKKDIERGDCALVDNAHFKRQATNIHYEIDDKCIKLEAKEKMKKRLGISPDDFDATSICNWNYHYGVVSGFSKRMLVGKNILDDL